MPKRREITLDFVQHVRKVLRCDNGRLFWRIDVARRSKAGQEAGYFHKGIGRYLVTIRGKPYIRSILVWILHNDTLCDDRIENLRAVSVSVNNQNIDKRSGLTSEHIGVHQHKNGSWVAQKIINKTRHYLGSAGTEHEAYQLVCKG